MPCWVRAELENDWKRLVESHVGAQTSGYDSPTVSVYWQMIEHRRNCEVCRDDEVIYKLKDILGKPR